MRHDRKNKPTYLYWDIGFAIVLRGDDKNILERIRETLECGKISIDRRGMARYEVTNLKDLKTRIAPFFSKISTTCQKYSDFLLWEEALKILIRNQQNKGTRIGVRGFQKIAWDSGDLRRLEQIHEEMRVYKSIKTSSIKVA